MNSVFKIRLPLWIAILALWLLPNTGTAADRAVRIIDSSVGKLPFTGDLGLFSDHRTVTAITDPSYVLNERPPLSAGPSSKKSSKEIFYVYSDWHSPLNHFIPSGWMGDYEDLHFDEKNTESPADGKTCIKITYLARVTDGYAWAGIYWQTPENNWGDKPGGYNLTGMKRLTFWARGARGGERISEFRVGGMQGELPDTGLARIGPVILTPEWRKYQIDLTEADLSHITGGFAWSASYIDNSDGLTFYLDEIAFNR